MLYHIPLYHFPLYQFPFFGYIKFCYIVFRYSSVRYIIFRYISVRYINFRYIKIPPAKPPSLLSADIIRECPSTPRARRPSSVSFGCTLPRPSVCLEKSVTSNVQVALARSGKRDASANVSITLLVASPHHGVPEG